jgi:protein-S-isoprenylcysteine O-methyltransferase Ste14
MIGGVICRNCGTEIADKAIVCYRCGTATAEPVRQPAAIRRRPGRLLPLVALVLLVLLGLYLGQAGQTVVPPGYRLAAGICLAAAIVLLIVRIVRRR